MYCKKCGQVIKLGQKFCPKCGTPVGIQEAKEKNSADFNNTKSNSHTIVDSLNKYVGGGDNHIELNWKDLFRDVFKHHRESDAEEIFACGTPKTTPEVADVSSSWPRPWLYSRVLAGFIIAFILLRLCCEIFGNEKTLPGMMFVGSFAVPFSLVVMFMELNVFKNVSFYYVMKTFLIGGCASLLLTLFLYKYIVPEDDEMTFAMAFGVGVTEELGKVLIAFFFLRQLTKTRSILVGLLVGSCVGAGFAAFETLGYTFDVLAVGSWDDLLKIIYLRGILAPGGHVAWAAISGAALVIANREDTISSSVFGEMKFWRLFIIPIICHTIWDSPIEWGSEYCLVQLILCLIIWIFVLLLVNMGLGEIDKISNVSKTQEG